MEFHEILSLRKFRLSFGWISFFCENSVRYFIMKIISLPEWSQHETTPTPPPKWPVRPKAGLQFFEGHLANGILAFLGIPPPQMTPP